MSPFSLKELLKRKKHDSPPIETQSAKESALPSRAPRRAPSPEEPPPSEEPEVPVLREKLWNEAYDELRKSNKGLVEAYENILSARLSGKDLKSDEAWAGGNSIGQTHETRWQEMRKVIDIGLKSTEKVSNLKGKINEGAQAIATVKGLVDSAVKASPEASVAWAGVCFGLEVIANPITQPGLNRKGLAFALSRMEWYWNLVDLLLDENRNKETATKGLRDQLERHIVQLYQALLAYQMKSIYLYHLNWAKVILRDMFKLDDWAGQLTELEDAEKSVIKDSKTYNTEYVKSQFDSLLKSSKTQESHLEGILETLQSQMKREEKRYQDAIDTKCLQELSVGDPRSEKVEIEDKKGGLLDGAYAWILPGFEKFLQDPHHQVFWIKGEPGQGKTMMMCGIINELTDMPDHGLTYFFCQEPEANKNNATAVLRGLIWLLAEKIPGLIQHIREKYDTSGDKLFSNQNAWVSLAGILTKMLQDERSERVVLAIDALDECKTNRDQLLNLILTLSSSTPARWVLSSRDWKDIDDKLKKIPTATINLKSHDDDLSQAVDYYINYRLKQLEDTISQKNLAIIRDHLTHNAHGTFLWVGLVCTELTKAGVQNYDAVDIAKEFPADLNPLYERMMKHISSLRRAKTCYQILAVICTVYRHLSITELQGLIESLEDFTQDDMTEIIRSCGSFLSVRGDTVQLVHQTAKDFLTNEAAGTIFPSGLPSQHHTIFQTSMRVLSNVLKQNIYNLDSLGLSTEQISTPDPDPLAGVRYGLLFWDEHFIESQSGEEVDEARSVLLDFLQEHFWHWLEALSLIGRVSDSVTAFHSLEAFMGGEDSNDLADLVRDARRFILTYRHAIAAAPLQVYAAPLIFSPLQSQVKEQFQGNRPEWIVNDIPLEEYWDACTFTLEHHGEQVKSVVFSEDGKLLFSASSTGTLRTWDTTTGACLNVVDSDKRWVHVLLCDGKPRAFSSTVEQKIHVLDLMTGSEIQTLQIEDIERPEVIGMNSSKTVVIGSSDMITIWNPDTAECVDKLNLKVTKRTAGSPLAIHNNRLAIASLELLTSKVFIKIWDLKKKKCAQTLEGHKRNLDWLAFSGSEKRLISASYDETIKLWDVDRKQCLQTFQAPGKSITKAILLEKEKQVALGADDGTMMIWDVKSGSCVETFHAHNEYIDSFALSPKSKQLASGSKDGTIKIWDITNVVAQGFGHVESSERTQRPNGHTGQVNVVAISSDGRYAASGAQDGKILIWEAHEAILLQSLQGHSKTIYSIVFEENGKFATGSEDCMAKVWDLDRDEPQHSLIHDKPVNAVVFHPDGRIATASKDNKIRLWDLETESCVQVIECKKEPILLAFSNDGQRLAAAEWLDGINLWNLATGDPLPIPAALVALISEEKTPVYKFDIMEHPMFRLKQTAFPLRSLAQSEWWSTRGPWNSIDLSSVVETLLAEESQFSGPSGFAISADKSWLLKDDEKILWLPVEFRPSSLAVVGSTVAIGCYGGEVLVLYFPEDSLKL